MSYLFEVSNKSFRMHQKPFGFGALFAERKKAPFPSDTPGFPARRHLNRAIVDGIQFSREIIPVPGKH